MREAVWIIGTSMTEFRRHPDKQTIDLGAEAALAALADANRSITEMGVVAFGSVFEPSPAQAMLKLIGQTGVPAYNVRNACATGATALRTVMMEILAGETDLGLAVGAERMGKAGIQSAAGSGGPSTTFSASGPVGAICDVEGILGTSTMPGIFAMAGVEYARTYDGVGFEQFVKVAEKNHRNSVLNPLAQYQKEYSFEEIAGADLVSWPNTKLMCCPTSDGAAAVVVASDRLFRRLDPDVRRRAVRISAAVLNSDPYAPEQPATYDFNTLTRRAAAAAYEQAGLGPDDLDMVELHDCFASAELLHYDNLGLCQPGGAGEFVDSGAGERGGRIPVNVSGGLISKGHPLGATGLANIYEVTTHLRGEAGERQLPNVKVGLTHVLGMSSACAVHILERAAS
jgi:acetyl-CoA acetyltransferase